MAAAVTPSRATDLSPPGDTGVVLDLLVRRDASEDSLEQRQHRHPIPSVHLCSNDV